MLALIVLLWIPNVPASSSRAFGPASTPVLQVWFDAPPQRTISYPPAYLFNVAAKTASGLWITNLHWDFGDGATLDVPFSAQSQVSDIRAHQYASQSNYCVTVTAYDSAGNTASASQPLMPVHDFSLAVNPATAQIAAGGSTTYNVAVGSSPSACGGSVEVNLAVSTPASQGPTWTISPTSGQIPFNSTLQAQTSNNTPNGTYTVFVLGTSGNVTHTVAVSLVVTGSTFALSVPTQPTVIGQNSTVTIFIQSINGFNNQVTLSTSGAPQGSTLIFSTSTITPPANGQAPVSLTVITPCYISPGPYVIIVQGSSNGIVRQVSVPINVSACGGGFDWFTTFILASIVGSLVLLPILFLLFRRRGPVVAPVPVPAPAPVLVTPAPPPPPTPVPVPQIVPCPLCGHPLSPAPDGKWHCGTCHRRIWVAP